MMRWFTDSWYQPSYRCWLLTPLSGLYRLVTSLRRLAYKKGLLQQYKMPVPVIVVGNISVGGSGKTPFVIWLAEQLTAAGLRPGIISRGYGGQASSYPQRVTTESNPAQVGDEPVMIVGRTACPMVVDPDRVRGSKYLLQNTECNVIITDDGLQHYRLQRDIEIAIVDAQRGFGNRHCLPAGPLREPISRLKQVDFVVFNGEDEAHYTMRLQQDDAVNLLDSTQIKPLNAFTVAPVHAVAGIGNPWRFFQQLQDQQLTITAHTFADHHHYQTEDLQFNDNAVILMTEKDAVKCRTFATDNMWYVPVSATLSADLDKMIMLKLRSLING